MFNFIKKYPEIYFVYLIWTLVLFIYTISSLLFYMEVSFLTYLYLAGFLFCYTVGFLSIKRKNQPFVSFKEFKINYLLIAGIGFLPVMLMFYQSLGNLGKSISSVREDYLMTGSKNGSLVLLYNLLFPLLIGAFITALSKNIERRWLIVTLMIISCFAFIPINGGRINFVILVTLIAASQMIGNYSRIIHNKVKYTLIGFFSFFILILLGSLYHTTRTGNEVDALIEYYSTMTNIKPYAFGSIIQLSYGFELIIILNNLYNYMGGCIHYFNIFLLHGEIELTYGLYQFNIIDRLKFVDFMQKHDEIDAINARVGIEYNVWATALREFIVDFGKLGALLFAFILGRLLGISKRLKECGFFSNIMYYLIFAIMIFSPFYSFLVIKPISVLFLYLIPLVLYEKYSNRHFYKINN